MRNVLIAAVMLLIAGGDSFAQDEAPTKSHERAAEELVEVLQLERMATVSTDLIAQAMSGPNTASPEQARMVAAITDIIAEFMRWENLRPEYVRIYRDAFTESELKEMIAFYRTPVGRKMVDVTPELTRQSMEVGQKLMEQHMPEIQRRVEAMIRERIGS